MVAPLIVAAELLESAQWRWLVVPAGVLAIAAAAAGLVALFVGEAVALRLNVAAAVGALIAFVVAVAVVPGWAWVRWVAAVVVVFVLARGVHILWRGRNDPPPEHRAEAAT